MEKRLATSLLALSVLLPWLAQHPLWAANPRNHIEAVKRKARVVYVGVVREVSELRGGLDISARATIRVLSVLRAPAGTSAAEATLEYSSYDEKAPPLTGGPQYRLPRGTMVLVFTSSFSGAAGYVLHGSRADLLRQVEVLREGAARMTDTQLKFNEITEDDRRVQVQLYESVSAFLHSTS